jgi:ammonium transporter, Amt family
VAITPAAGNVGIPGAFAIGLGVGVVCLWGVTGLKKIIKADDSLDVFGVHALGGIFGALTTGIFNAPSLGGPGSVQDWVKGTVGYPGIGAQLWIQLKAVVIVTVWTAVVATVAFLVVKAVMGLRVSEEQEREGLDITSHGERAYDM